MLKLPRNWYKDIATLSMNGKLYELSEGEFIPYKPVSEHVRQRIDGAMVSNKRILKEIEESGLSQDEYLKIKYGSFAIPDDNIHNNDHANNND